MFLWVSLVRVNQEIHEHWFPTTSGNSTVTLGVFIPAYAFIRQFGRLLQLDNRDLDEVEQYSAYGTKEVFWQTIRLWLENSDSQHMTVSYLMTALSECGVNLKDKGLKF
jgi:hypothetical protein